MPGTLECVVERTRSHEACLTRTRFFNLPLKSAGIMVPHATNEFLAGVIEGFYGPPWSTVDRLELFDWMAAWGLDTYVYAPKDDLNHRLLWREPYPAIQAAALGDLIRACGRRKLRFVYALSPGLDIRYADAADLERIRKRFAQMLGLGCGHFALLFDDIPDRMRAADIRRFGSFASAQCHIANTMFRWVRQRVPGARFLFCPTAYCGRMAGRGYGGQGYLETVGRELLPQIDVFWTGPEIVSGKISVAHVREIRRVLRRKPVLWDNLHANDYDARRFFCGPYAGRPPALRAELAGVCSNPNCELPLNYVPLRTLAWFLGGGRTWNARRAWRAAMQEWWPRFAVVGPPVKLTDLMRLGDCYYLPHQEGPEAEALYQGAKLLLRGMLWQRYGALARFRQRVTRLRAFCERLAGLRDRRLFAALSRRIWELREELDLLERYAAWKVHSGSTGTAFQSDFHLPGTYRGGLVARLQQLWVQQPNGRLVPAESVRPPDPGSAWRGAKPGRSLV